MPFPLDMCPYIPYLYLHIFKSPLTSTPQLPWHFKGVELPIVKEIEKKKKAQAYWLPPVTGWNSTPN